MGGSSSSKTSQASTTQDNRQVITNTSSSYDLSNRSTNAYDLSDKSQSNSNNNLYDASSTNTTTNTYNSTLDGGAIAGGLAVASDALSKMFGLAEATTGAATAATKSGYSYADGLFNSALDFAGANDARLASAYDRASAVQSGAINQLQGAYADAKGTSAAQEKIILAVLVVAGIFAMSAFKKA
ncbi:hypothetical protein [Janthinobacterium sp. ZB1P44]|uniref:hypothetical protein n=1 Tax=Janthinobacterium sp. ZB1P44 TaxID=3424192 RepID=UPI003F2062F5